MAGLGFLYPPHLKAANHAINTKQAIHNLKPLDQNQKQLIKLAHTKMPFGKYEGWFLIDIPEYYIVWYSNKGFPKGELGEQLKLIYELKLNGLEELIRNIKKNYPKP
jgi:uncharacterized protein (DUF3820 family)